MRSLIACFGLDAIKGRFKTLLNKLSLSNCFKDLLVADNAVIGNCIDTVNVKSDPVGNITDLFLLDFTIVEGNVWFLYFTDVSLASIKESVEKTYVLLLGEAWHNDIKMITCMARFTEKSMLI